MPKFIVYMHQVNQTFIEVTAKDEEAAREISKEKWRHDYAWPEVMSVETCDPPEPQFRPFASAAEFMPHEGRTLRFKGATGIVKTSSFSDIAHNALNWGASLEQKEFVDLVDGSIVASPFGVLITEAVER